MVRGAAGPAGEGGGPVNTNTRARQCASKRKHLTRRAAAEHLERLISEGASPDALNVYRCKHKIPGVVEHWHVGHTTKAQRRTA